MTSNHHPSTEWAVMNLAQHIRSTLEMPMFVVNAYLEDLVDADLLVRPLASMNHLAWQLGHLISSENFHINQVCPGGMPSLPEGFANEYSKETAVIDDASFFRSKDEYLSLMREQRTGTLSLLDGLSDDELNRPSPERIRYFGPTVGSVFAGESAHWMMHVGQWAVIRRKLGKPPLF
jgi:hypothetical protein